MFEHNLDSRQKWGLPTLFSSWWSPQPPAYRKELSRWDICCTAWWMWTCHNLRDRTMGLSSVCVYAYNALETVKVFLTYLAMHLCQGNCSDWRVCFLRPDTEWNAAGTEKSWHKSVKLYTRRNSAALNLSLCGSDFIPDMRKLPSAEFAVHCVKSRPVYKTRLLWALFELPSMSAAAAAPLLRTAPSHQLTAVGWRREQREAHSILSAVVNRHDGSLGNAGDLH